MNNLFLIGVVFISFFCSHLSIAQPLSPTKTLTYEDYIKQLLQYHPMVELIGYAKDRAVLSEQYARGNMDPQVHSKWAMKAFDGKSYYDLFDGYLQLPTLLGLDIKAGYHWANGTYINPENKLPQAGQAYVGIQLPLTQGLINNERVTALRQAKLLQKASEAEIASAINNLMYEAALAYWEWALAYNETLVFSQSLVLAQEQYDMVQQLVQQGDLSPIDTLKALIRIQDFKIQYNEAQLQLRKSQWKASNYLWEANQKPLELDELSLPILFDSLAISPLDSQVLNVFLNKIEQHPDLLQYSFSLQSLDIERRFKSTKLLPKAELQYNLLSTNQFDFFGNAGVGAFNENYKFGLKFSMPIFLRQERADLSLNNLKQKETNLKWTYKKQELVNKAKTYFFEVSTYYLQNELIKKMVDNYTLLLEAEKTKFRMGESELFVVNTREVQYVEARRKQYQNYFKLLKAKTSWWWSTAEWTEN